MVYTSSNTSYWYFNNVIVFIFSSNKHGTWIFSDTDCTKPTTETIRKSRHPGSATTTTNNIIIITIISTNDSNNNNNNNKNKNIINDVIHF